MKGAETTGPDAEIELLDDEVTTVDFVVQVARSVLGRTEAEAQALVRRIGRDGAARVGPFDRGVADAMLRRLLDRAAAAGFPLQARLVEAVAQPQACSFCRKPAEGRKHLYRGEGALICDECLLDGARALRTATPRQVMRHVHEVLAWHFGGLSESDLVSVRRVFPVRVRADLQRALDGFLSEARTFGVHAEAFQPITFAGLLGERRHPSAIGPLQYDEVDIGEAAPLRCLVNALWLLREDDVPVAVLLSKMTRHVEDPGVAVSVAAPAGEAGQRFAERVFARLEEAVALAQAYRGKVLSLETESDYRGTVAGVRVHRLAPVAREDVVLPEATLRLIDRNVVGFARARAGLVALGQSAKKGLLFHGPPGTGKTHTVRYLAGCLPDHTTLLVTAEQIGHIDEYFLLARLLQPAILVIEDADLIARNRADMGGPCEEVLLNRLLNEMDGLRPDAALFVVLTTNRPEALEAALAQRPGRIDQAIEFPVPDVAGRRKLLRLYGGGLDLDEGLAEAIARRTEGVSPAFLKELARRLAQAVLDGGGGPVAPAHVDEALGELLLGRDRVDLGLLGTA